MITMIDVTKFTIVFVLIANNANIFLTFAREANYNQDSPKIPSISSESVIGSM